MSTPLNSAPNSPPPAESCRWREHHARIAGAGLRWLGLMLGLILGVTNLPAAFTPGPFYVNYSARVPSEPLTVHPWVIVDPSAQALDFAAARAAGTRVLAYLSVGELGASASYRRTAVAAGLPLRGVNTIWNSDLLDLRDGRWATFLVDGPARTAMAAGFDGFFLDTLDSVELSATNAEIAAQRAGLIALIQKLRATYPNASIVVNRGFGVLDSIRSVVNGLLVESVWATYDFNTLRYRAVPAAETAVLLPRLASAAANGLEVFVLDYTDPADPVAALAASKRILAAGYHAFVSTPALNGVNLGPWQPIVPAMAREPSALTVRPGDRVELRALVNGSPTPTLVWRRGGIVVPGATGSVLRLAAATAADAALYTVTATNAYGTATSAAARLTVDATAPRPQIANLSARAQVSGGDAQLIPGIVTEGPVRLLVRGIGPTLRDFGVTTALADPALRVVAATGVELATATNWTAALASAATTAGAFSLTTGRGDVGVVLTVQGAVTVPVRSQAGGSGIALGEVFVVPSPESTGRLINLAARATVADGERALVVGFVVSGPTAATVLVRGVGPALTPFGVTGVLVNPRLELRAADGTLLAAHDDWSADTTNADDVTALTARLGTFALPRGSRDAALAITLPPGAYTATVRSADSAPGVALAEIYLAP